MPNYWLSFRVSTKKDGPIRRGNLINAARAIATSNLTWEETTSYIAFESELSIRDVMNALKVHVDKSIDLILVRSMNTRSALIHGHNASNHLYSLMVNDDGSTYLSNVP